MPSPSDSVAELKRRLRHEMSQRRIGCAPSAQATASGQLCSRLDGLQFWASSAVVAGFSATKGEIDPAAALHLCEQKGAVVVWPRTSALTPRLSFHRANSAAHWCFGAFGIREPVACSPWVPIESIDAVLVPGLAFDSRGGRLGWGGGFYDELSNAIPCRSRTVLVGVAHDFQLVDHCPVEPSDVFVDWVVTDQKVIRCAKQNSLTDYLS